MRVLGCLILEEPAVSQVSVLAVVVPVLVQRTLVAVWANLV